MGILSAILSCGHGSPGKKSRLHVKTEWEQGNLKEKEYSLMPFDCAEGITSIPPSTAILIKYSLDFRWTSRGGLQHCENLSSALQKSFYLLFIVSERSLHFLLPLLRIQLFTQLPQDASVVIKLAHDAISTKASLTEDSRDSDDSARFFHTPDQKLIRECDSSNTVFQSPLLWSWCDQKDWWKKRNQPSRNSHFNNTDVQTISMHCVCQAGYLP